VPVRGSQASTLPPTSKGSGVSLSSLPRLLEASTTACACTLFLASGKMVAVAIPCMMVEELPWDAAAGGSRPTATSADTCASSCERRMSLAIRSGGEEVSLAVRKGEWGEERRCRWEYVVGRRSVAAPVARARGRDRYEHGRGQSLQTKRRRTPDTQK